MGFFVPEYLKKINNWVVWKKEGQKYVKKVPYDPRTGRRANPTKSCCCYDEAINFYKYGGSFDGIGFCFTQDCNMTFIDLDNCITKNDEETELAKQLQIMFSDCYMEYSQSEKGIHIICIGSIPRAIKTPEIEIYSKDRYVALTGNNLNFNEPQEAQERLNKLFEKYSKNFSNHLLNSKSSFRLLEKDQTITSTKDINTLTQIIKRSKQGEKWQRLHNGNLQGYKSTSEAAQAYIAIVNYFANGNEKLIKILFSLSQFSSINQKYKEDYYIDRMITNSQKSLTYKRSKVNTKNRNQLEDIKETKRKHF